MFCGGLDYGYIKMKLFKKEPDKLERAVEICMREQHLMKRK